MSEQIRQLDSSLKSAYAVDPDLQLAVESCTEAPVLAHVLKNYALRQIMMISGQGRYFMLALMDVVEWASVADRLVAGEWKSAES